MHSMVADRMCCSSRSVVLLLTIMDRFCRALARSPASRQDMIALACLSMLLTATVIFSIMADVRASAIIPARNMLANTRK